MWDNAVGRAGGAGAASGGLRLARLAVAERTLALMREATMPQRLPVHETQQLLQRVQTPATHQHQSQYRPVTFPVTFPANGTRTRHV